MLNCSFKYIMEMSVEDKITGQDYFAQAIWNPFEHFKLTFFIFIRATVARTQTPAGTCINIGMIDIQDRGERGIETCCFVYAFLTA
ncbi:hypothetical protein JZ751_008781 [Albula glossodonta]|uniref:Uncharacterized protein n=1 Tax=Albula glossodonta TaxID=121402 RepID=A0A8T2PAB6_9TELE|nr:hypothetical protein JZ751_008781 [Albula glossodonta]